MKISRKKIARILIFILPLIILRCIIEIFRFSAKGEIPYELLDAYLNPLLLICGILMGCLILLYYDKFTMIIFIVLITIAFLVVYKIKVIQPIYNDKYSGKYERMNE